ncbi:MAG: CAP domain-containing protein [Candidatus Acidiferrales bacterium]|jgi:uncharacterized protein YkwD
MSETHELNGNPVNQGSRIALAIAILVVMVGLSTSKATAAPTPKAVSASIAVTSSASAELEMFQLLNNDRTAPAQAAEAGPNAHPLSWDPKLAAVARARAQELANGATFQHVTADGLQPWDRLSKAGVQWVSMGENLAVGQSIAQAEAAFMNEAKFQDNHRGNIVNKTFTSVGIGIAVGQDGTLYITEEFVQAR